MYSFNSSAFLNVVSKEILITGYFSFQFQLFSRYNPVNNFSLPSKADFKVSTKRLLPAERLIIVEDEIKNNTYLHLLTFLQNMSYPNNSILLFLSLQKGTPAPQNYLFLLVTSSLIRTPTGFFYFPTLYLQIQFVITFQLKLLKWRKLRGIKTISLW